MDSRIVRFILTLPAAALISACASLPHYDCGGVVTGTGAHCLTVLAANVQHSAATSHLDPTLAGIRRGDDDQQTSILNDTQAISAII